MRLSLPFTVWKSFSQSYHEPHGAFNGISWGYRIKAKIQLTTWTATYHGSQRLRTIILLANWPISKWCCHRMIWYDMYSGCILANKSQWTATRFWASCSELKAPPHTFFNTIYSPSSCQHMSFLKNESWKITWHHFSWKVRKLKEMKAPTK